MCLIKTYMQIFSYEWSAISLLRYRQINLIFRKRKTWKLVTINVIIVIFNCHKSGILFNTCLIFTEKGTFIYKIVAVFSEKSCYVSRKIKHGKRSSYKLNVDCLTEHELPLWFTHTIWDLRWNWVAWYSWEIVAENPVSWHRLAFSVDVWKDWFPE